MGSFVISICSMTFEFKKGIPYLVKDYIVGYVSGLKPAGKAYQLYNSDFSTTNFVAIKTKFKYFEKHFHIKSFHYFENFDMFNDNFEIWEFPELKLIDCRLISYDGTSYVISVEKVISEKIVDKPLLKHQWVIKDILE